MHIIIRGKNTPSDPYASSKRSEEGRSLARKSDWVQGVWEHIDKEPIYIRDKKHLKEECTKRGVIPKAFMKRKSQGKGHEWTY